jgi:HD-GYP domain-containing protein (c-di-GMP phosphodiesterase class II)
MTDQAVEFTHYLGLGNNPNETKLLHNLVKLHDVGNLALPNHILDKTTPLDDEEWEIVKTHSEIGYRMAQSVGEWELADAILGMHERWDGTGYPYALAGEQIPYYSRLLAILDAFDVMTNAQAYKQAISTEEALEAIKEAAGKQFDPQLVDAYLQWSHMNREQAWNSSVEHS